MAVDGAALRKVDCKNGAADCVVEGCLRRFGECVLNSIQTNVWTRAATLAFKTDCRTSNFEVAYEKAALGFRPIDAFFAAQRLVRRTCLYAGRSFLVSMGAAILVLLHTSDTSPIPTR